MEFNSQENMKETQAEKNIPVTELALAELREDIKIKALRHAYAISGGDYPNEGYLVMFKHGLPHPHFVAFDASYTKAEADKLLCIGSISELFAKYEDEL